MALEKRELKLKNGLTKDPENNFIKCSSNINMIENWAREFDRDVRNEFSEIHKKIEEDCFMSNSMAIEELKELIKKTSEKPVKVEEKTNWQYAREGVASVSNLIGNATTFLIFLGALLWKFGLIK